MTKARDLFRAFFLVPSHELSLFLLRVNRVPVFLVGRGDRFLAFPPVIVRRCGGGCLAALGLGYGFTRSAFVLRGGLAFWSGVGFGFFVVVGHRLSSGQTDVSLALRTGCGVSQTIGQWKWRKPVSTTTDLRNIRFGTSTSLRSRDID